MGDNASGHVRRDYNRPNTSWRSNSRDRNNATDDGNSTSQGRFRSSRESGPSKENRQNLEKQSRSDERGEKEEQILDFKELEALLSEDADLICLTLSYRQEEFINLLKSSKVKDNWVIIILKLVEKVVKYNTTNKTEIEYVKDVVTVSCRYFIEHIIKYIAFLPLQSQSEKSQNRYYWEDPISFWQALIVVCDKIIQLLPKRARDDCLSKLLKAMSLYTMSESHSEIEMDRIKKQLAILKKNISKNESDKESDDKEDEEDGLSLRDYRRVSILPTSKEILTPKRPEIRENRSGGKYKSISDYLNVQFKLLREDFIDPLRERLCNSLDDENYLKKYDNRIYKKVTFQSIDFLQSKLWYQNKLICVVDLKLSKKDLDELKYSKRLSSESLLVFISNEFKTAILAKVANRDINLLQKGQIGVELTYTEIGIEHLLGKKCDMIEATIYFEPYCRVTKALQTITEENFPLKKYIIDLEIESKPPRYLEQNSHLKVKNWEIDVLSPSDWVSANDLGYDEMQYNAFRSALTKEFSVIQGPPGTGKTFIGLELVNVLLENKNIWYKETPILIICYTNHALDQFLEGILKMTNHVDHIVRLGSKSRNKNIEKIDMCEFHRRWEKNNKIPSNYKQTAYQIRTDMKDCLSKIRYLQMSLQEIHDKNCIIDVTEELRKKDIEFNNSDDFFIWLVDRTNYIEEIAIAAEPQRQFETDFNFSNTNLSSGLNNQENSEIIELETNQSDDSLEVIDDADDILSEINFSMYSQERRKTWRLKTFEDDLVNLRQKHTTANNSENKRRIQKQLQIKQALFNYLKCRLNQNTSKLPPPKYQFNNVRDLDSNHRWSLYWDCIKIYRKQLFHSLDDALRKYRKLNVQREEILQKENAYILKSSWLVGMTTTYAANHHTLLQRIKSPIVIVEEAAEVLESHIITSITDNCQHLVLIGDHKQLRPSNTVYRLKKYFDLDVSLFERMVKNGKCEVLNVQHRMRPEFVNLIIPTIYSELKNHHPVSSYQNIIGVKQNLFFITHNHQVGDAIEESYHEAKFLLRLCKHLLLQGYKPRDITILTIYIGQMHYMRKEQNNMECSQDVRIMQVGDFQGEENKIILLSLASSNTDVKIDRLEMEYRICIAFSRAKEGMYIIGNTDNLEENSVWQKIKKILKQQCSIGNKLPLQCKIHPDQITYVSRAEDFQKCSEGGCNSVCNFSLSCGHKCTRKCHLQDREHKDYECSQAIQVLCCDNNKRRKVSVACQTMQN